MRYPPANSVDREAHAARVALLAEDCADIPVQWLNEAACDWAREKPFFPKACELRDEANAWGRRLAARHTRTLPAPYAEPRRIAEPNVTPEQAASILAEFGLRSLRA